MPVPQKSIFNKRTVFSRRKKIKKYYFIG